MRFVALIVAMCMVATLLLTPIALQAQSNDWTSSAEAKAHWNLAYNAMRADDDMHAAEEFRLATQADPKFAEAYYYRGLVLVLQAFVKEKKKIAPAGAAESFQMYLALKPTGILATDSFSMLKELGAVPRSDEVTRKANSILAAKPQPAAQTTSRLVQPQNLVEVAHAEDAPGKTSSLLAAKPQPTVTVAKPVATQKPVPTSTPIATQSRVDVALENAAAKPPTQIAASSSRTGDPAAAPHKTTRDANPQASLAVSNTLSKPPIATAPLAASTQCVRYEIAHKGECGTPDEVEIRAWNPCAQPSAIQVCVQETTGHWNCAMSLHSRKRSSYTGVDGARQYVCHGTGRFRALSLPSGQDLPIFPPISQ